MSDPDERPEPREMNEQRAIDMMHASRAKLTQEAARFRLALTELEYAAMALLVQEAAITLMERSATGRTPKIVNTRELMALAIAGRLSGVLAPYLDGAGGDWPNWETWAAGALEDSRRRPRESGKGDRCSVGRSWYGGRRNARRLRKTHPP